jgi:hypothetical protein
MGLLRLAPETREHILALPETVHCPEISERTLRPITQIEDRGRQAEMFDALIGKA